MFKFPPKIVTLLQSNISSIFQHLHRAAQHLLYRHLIIFGSLVRHGKLPSYWYSLLLDLFYLFVCMFGIFVPLENLSLMWRRHHYRWKAANFDLCSIFMATERWGFLSLPHLLCHGASVYNGHLRGPVTLTPTAEHLAVKLSLPVFTT